MPKQAKRRFVGLDTEEVSLVDSPANELEFLVLKNQEKRMAGQQQEKATVTVDVDGDDDKVVKALAHVNSIVAKVAGFVETKKEAKPPKDDDDKEEKGGDDDAKDPDTDETETAKSVAAAFAEAGLDAKTTKQLLVKLEKAGFPFPPKPGKGKGKGKAKADDDEDEEKTKKSVDGDEPLTLAGLVSVVQKAAAFTPARVKALQDAQEILKIVLESVAPSKSPDSNVPALETHSNPSSISDLTKPNKKPVVTMKSESELVDTIKALSDGVGTLLTRVEAIEKARPASNSVGDDGPPETTTKTSKSLWSGVL